MKKFVLTAVSVVLLLLSGCGSKSAEVTGTENVRIESDTQAVEAENSEIIETSETAEITTELAESDTALSESLPVETSEKAETTETTEISEKASETEYKPVFSSETSASVVQTLTNSWKEGDKAFEQYSVTYENKGGDENGWEITLYFPASSELVQGWNGIFSLEKGVMTVKNESYNGSLKKGEKTEVGFIIKHGGEPAATTATSQETNKTPKPSETDLQEAATGSVSEHGQLSVKDGRLIDENGNAFQLCGVSTHGIQWFPAFVNKDAFSELKSDWGANAVRLAMYTGESEGYTESKKADIEALLESGIEICKELDLYCIVDWHLLGDQNPEVRKQDAVRFFDYISEKYGDLPNIVYEICNEPNGNVSWSDNIKPYAEEIISVIRENDPDGVIIVGTPTWSQDIDRALADPLSDENVMYALHFYAATHKEWLQDRLSSCANAGLPVFVSEFGCCDASGNGANDFSSAEEWLDLLDSFGISYIGWALADKNETCCFLSPGASSDGGWYEDGTLSEAGQWLRERLREKSGLE